VKTSYVLIAIALAGCGGGGGGTVDGSPVDGGAVDAVDVSARPFDLFVPTGYVAGTPTPLVVLLHGYGATGAIQESYFQLQPVAEAQTFLYATPDGTLDGSLNHYWNATDGCCDVGHLDVDDVGYLRALIDDVATRYTVDPKRIYLVGHSNGGFMAHRMACDDADQIAAIVSLAGVTWNDPTQCTPSGPVSIAQVHGTADTTISYTGGMVFGLAPYPSAQATVDAWASRNACTGTDATTMVDLITDVAGDETTVTRSTGCVPGGGVELWTIAGGGHVPGLVQPTWAQALWAFLAAHPKP